MNDLLRNIIQNATGIGVARTLETLGVSSGEISYRQAVLSYGKWFTDAAKDGRIKPVFSGSGKNGMRHYRVSDILVRKVEEDTRAVIILQSIKY